MTTQDIFHSLNIPTPLFKMKSVQKKDNRGKLTSITAALQQDIIIPVFSGRRQYTIFYRNWQIHIEKVQCRGAAALLLQTFAAAALSIEIDT